MPEKKKAASADSIAADLLKNGGPNLVDQQQTNSLHSAKS
jgi:hypothetical protein